MRTGLEEYVSGRLEQLGVIGYSPTLLTQIAAVAAEEALDTCDLLIESLGEGGPDDMLETALRRRTWPNATGGPFTFTTLTQLARDPDDLQAWHDWITGRFKTARRA